MGLNLSTTGKYLDTNGDHYKMIQTAIRKARRREPDLASKHEQLAKRVENLTDQLNAFQEKMSREMFAMKTQYEVTVKKLTNRVAAAERQALKHNEEAQFMKRQRDEALNKLEKLTNRLTETERQKNKKDFEKIQQLEIYMKL